MSFDVSGSTLTEHTVLNNDGKYTKGGFGDIEWHYDGHQNHQ